MNLFRKNPCTGENMKTRVKKVPRVEGIVTTSGWVNPPYNATKRTPQKGGRPTYKDDFKPSRRRALIAQAHASKVSDYRPPLERAFNA